MKKNILILAAVAIAAVPACVAFQARAEDAAKTTTMTTSTTTMSTDVMEKTLMDGTKLHVKGDAVYVVGADGMETPAPDGEHTLSDGTKIKVMGGMMVHDGMGMKTETTTTKTVMPSEE